MAILNQWGIPYGTALLQAKQQPQLKTIIDVYVEKTGTHTEIVIHYHMYLEDGEEDYSDDM